MNSFSVKKRYRNCSVLELMSKLCVWLFPPAHFLCAGLGWGIVWDVISLFVIGVGLLNILARKKIVLHGYEAWIIAFFLCCTISLLFSRFSNFIVNDYINQIKMFVYGVAFMFTVSQKREYVDQCLLSIFISAVVLSIITISRADIDTILSIDEKYLNTQRSGLAEAENINITAFNMTVGFAMSSLYMTACMRKHEKIKRIFIRICQAVIFMGIFFTGTRKSLLAAAIVLAFELIDVKKIKSMILIAVLLAVGIYIVINVPLLYRLVGNRIESFIMGNPDISDITRVNLADEAKIIFMNNSIIGVGINGFRIYSNYGVYAHNNLLEILADFGMLGFISYYSIFAVIVYKIKNTVFDYRQRTAVLGVIIAYFTMEFSQVSYLLLTALLFLSITCVYMNINAKTVENRMGALKR